MEIYILYNTIIFYLDYIVLFIYPLYILNMQNLSPGVIPEVRSANYPPHRAFLAIINRYKFIIWVTILALKYQTPRKHFTCLTCFASLLGLSPFCRRFYKTLDPKSTIHQKNQGLYYTNYIYNKQIYINKHKDRVSTILKLILYYISYYVKKSVV